MSHEPKPYGGDDFFAEVATMIQVSDSRTVIELGSEMLAGMGDFVRAVDLDGASQPADILVSYNVLHAYPLEKVDGLIARIAGMTKRHALFSIPLSGWAEPEVEREFWLDRIRSGLSVDNIELTDREIIVLARNRELIGQVIPKGVLADERPTHMQAAHDFGFPYLGESPAHTGTLHIACFGPSVVDTLELMRGQDVMSLSGAHDLLIENGIQPKWHVESDPRPQMKDKFKAPHPDVEYLLASCCNPNLFEKLKGHKVKVWHNYAGPKHDELVAKLGGFQVQAGSVTGLAAIVIGYALGYRAFEIHGMDCSYRGENRHAGAHPGKIQKRMTVRLGDPVSGESFATTAQMVSAAREFFFLRQRMPDCTFTMHGTGLLQSMLKFEEAAKAA